MEVSFVLEIGDRIKQLRKSLNLTQSQFAILINISQSALSEIENNRFNPSLETLLSIKDKFGINLDWMISSNNITHPDTETVPEVYKNNLVSKVFKLITEEAQQLSKEANREIQPAEVSLTLSKHINSLFASVSIDSEEKMIFHKYHLLPFKDKKEVLAIIDIKYNANYQV